MSPLRRSPSRPGARAAAPSATIPNREGESPQAAAPNLTAGNHSPSAPEDDAPENAPDRNDPQARRHRRRSQMLAMLRPMPRSFHRMVVSSGVPNHEPSDHPNRSPGSIFEAGSEGHPFPDPISFLSEQGPFSDGIGHEHVRMLTQRISIVAVLLQRLQGKPKGATQVEIEEHTQDHVVTPPGPNEEVDTCPICLDEMAVGTTVCKLSCNHCFHPCCAQKWLGINKSCPICKLNITERRESPGKTTDTESVTEAAAENGGVHAGRTRAATFP